MQRPSSDSQQKPLPECHRLCKYNILWKIIYWDSIPKVRGITGQYGNIYHSDGLAAYGNHKTRMQMDGGPQKDLRRTIYRCYLSGAWLKHNKSLNWNCIKRSSHWVNFESPIKSDLIEWHARLDIEVTTFWEGRKRVALWKRFSLGRGGGRGSWK